MTDNWGFEIKQLDIRLLDSGECYEVKMQFTVDPSNHYRPYFERLTRDWVEPEFWLFNRTDYEQYLEEDKLEQPIDPRRFLDALEEPGEVTGLRRWNPPETAYSRLLAKRLDTTAFVSMAQPVLEYNAKNDTFEYYEFVTKNPAVDGILQYLQDLQQGKSYGHFVEISAFIHCIESLDKFWD